MSCEPDIATPTADLVAAAQCGDCARRGRCIGGLLVAGMTPEQINAVGMSRSVLDKGDHLFRVGEPAEHLYAVRGGALKTYVTTAAGEEEIRGFQLSEDIAGLDAVCQPQFRSSARALSRTWVCRLPIAAVQLHMLKSSSFRDKVLAGLGRELDRLHGMLHRERCSADQRVASFLISRLDSTAQSGAEVDLPMSRVDLARYLDMAAETISRVFTRLQKRNILRSGGAGCQVVDRAALYAMA